MNAPRSPREIAQPHMQTLARLPLFFALQDRSVVVAGGGAAAAWKLELLAAAGARIALFAKDPSDEVAAFLAGPQGGAATLYRRGVTAPDFAGAAIAVGDFEDEAAAAAFVGMARDAGVPVNVIDKPGFCDFFFGAIVNRSPLVIGISTDGAAPVFGQAIRARIEALIPRGFARWAEAARRWRPQVTAMALSFRARRRFWERFTERALAMPERAPGSADLAACTAAARDASDGQAGSVALVGAGPGDPELLTLRAVRALQSADVILFDDLVSPEVLDFARREAKKLLVGKTGHGPSCKQQDITALMVSLATAGKRVVRLKGGDPMIFGRATEELAACRQAGIPVAVVPGVTAAQGAAARLGVSLTRRGVARRVQYVAGHAEDGALPANLDWRGLADPQATTAIYMPRATWPAFAASATAHGLDPQTPAVAVIRATRDNEVVVTATVATLGARLAACDPGGPVLILVGQALAEAVAAPPLALPRSA